LENTRPVNRTKDDDIDRTSRVRAMEKELNSVLDENNVRFVFNKQQQRILHFVF